MAAMVSAQFLEDFQPIISIWQFEGEKSEFRCNNIALAGVPE